MELFKITKPLLNVSKSKIHLFFRLREENGGEPNHYEFEFSKTNQKSCVQIQKYNSRIKKRNKVSLLGLLLNEKSMAFHH